ncbi:MAG: hypothetical protein NZM31_15035 [Gemmatales bacterium]|nr:hypothetical protein [Gemmatales bacterium]MDW8388310.1 glycine cleavage T C-terminal barrel domain-containing protein [Gemmatales bacterium]
MQAIPHAEHYEAAVTRAVLFDVSARTEVEVRGGDRASFLHNFCTQDIVNLPVGRGCEALLLDVQGRILAYVRILARQESLWIDSEPGLGPKIVQHLDRYLITEQVALFDSTRELTQFHVAGPQAAALLTPVVGADLTTWQHLQHADLEAFGVRCQVRRNDMLSVPGYDLLFAATRNRTVLEGLTSLGIPQADMDTYHVLRIEAGTPFYGVDVDESNLPQELNRDDRLLCFTKGCYLGQETVVRIRDRGHVNRFLVGLRFERGSLQNQNPFPAIGGSPSASGQRELPGDPSIPVSGQSPSASGQRELPGEPPSIPPKTLLFHDGKEIGRITSSAWSPRLAAVIALGYVRRGLHEPGTVLTADGQSATVSALPFLSH